MAQRILGLDIGARNVRVAVIESTLRNVRLLGVDVEPIAPVAPIEHAVEGDESGVETAAEFDERRREAQLDAVRTLQRRGSLDADHVVTALPGDRVFTRILHFPFSDPRRIAQVVGFELEEHIPYDIDEVLIDHHVLHHDDEGATVFAAAVPIEEVAVFLGQLGEVGIDPRIVSLSTFGYAKLIEMAREVSDAIEAGPRCIAVVDVGHRRTEVTVMLDGHLAFARTVRRGAEHVHRAVAAAGGADAEAAERALAAHGRILTGGRDDPTTVDEHTRAFSRAIESGIAPILRDINQTLRNHEALHTEPVELILLAGGVATLPGLAQTLHHTLEVPTEILDHLPGNVESDGLRAGEVSSVGKAVGLALELVRGGSRDSVNFRRGPFAYKGDFQYLADRAPSLLMMAAMFILLLAGWYSVHRSNLVAERDRLEDQLAEFTKAVTGRAVRDPELAKGTLLAPPSRGYVEALPQRTGTWALVVISEAVERVRAFDPSQVPGRAGAAVRPGGPPPGVRVAAFDRMDLEPDDEDEGDEEPSEPERAYDLELERYDMVGNQGTVRGQANILEALEMFADELRRRPCFAKVSVEDTDKVSFDRHRGWLTFEIAWVLDCEASDGGASEKEDASPPAPAGGAPAVPPAGKGKAAPVPGGAEAGGVP